MVWPPTRMVCSVTDDSSRGSVLWPAPAVRAGREAALSAAAGGAAWAAGLFTSRDAVSGVMEPPVSAWSENDRRPERPASGTSIRPGD